MTNKQDSIFSDEDWKNLLPGKSMTLGSHTLFIKPFGLADLAPIIQKIMSLTDVFKAAGITQESFGKPENLPVLVPILVDNVPEIICVATGLSKSDLLRLPLARVIEIVNLIIEVNVESQEGLEKNLQALVANLGKLTTATNRA